MPLSKERMRERKRRDRFDKPKRDKMSNLIDTLQSNSSPLKDIGNSKLPPELDASGEIIPEYW